MDGLAVRSAQSLLATGWHPEAGSVARYDKRAFSSRFRLTPSSAACVASSRWISGGTRSRMRPEQPRRRTACPAPHRPPHTGCRRTHPVATSAISAQTATADFFSNLLGLLRGLGPPEAELRDGNPRLQ